MTSKAVYVTSGGILNYAAPTVKAQYPPGTLLFTSAIEVYLDGVQQVSGVDYVFNISTNNVELLADPGDNHVLEIIRVTPRSNRLVNYPSPTQLNQNHLNKDGFQWFFLIQEILDAIGERLRMIPTVVNGLISYVWDFGGKRGINCADPINPQDVATKAYSDLNLNNATAYTDTRIAIASQELRDYADAQDDIHSAADFAAAKSYTDSVKVDLVNTFNTSQSLQDTQINELRHLINALGAQITDLVTQAISVIMYPNSASCLIAYLTAGSTVAATPVDFVNALVFLGGFAQVPSVDYSHTSGNIITFNQPAQEFTQVQVYPVLSSVTQTAIVSGTNITFGQDYNYGILFVDGVLIAPSDLTHTPGTNTVTLSSDKWDGGKAMIFACNLIGEDERILNPGTTTVNFGVTFRNAIVFYSGIPQVNGLDYRHNGTESFITILSQPKEPVKMVTYFFA